MENMWPAAVAFMVAIVLVPISRALLLRLTIIDVPNERSSHTVLTPRGAGLAVGIAAFVGLTIGSADCLAAVLGLVSMALGALGFLDDCIGLSVRTRLVAQTTAAGAASALIILDGYVPPFPQAVVVAGAMLWIVGFVNTFNFMDGINGLSAAQAVVAGVALAIVGALYDLEVLQLGGVVLAGAFLGFLPYNVPKASIFLGDVGSYFAGSWLAVMVVIAVDAGIPPEVVVAPFLLYIVDSTLTLGLRVSTGQRIGEPHRDHAYQRLSRAWGSHSAVAALAALVMAVDAAIMIAVRDSDRGLRLGAFTLALLLATGFVVAGRRAEGVTV